MLEARHIRHLKLDQQRLRAHSAMPVPGYVKKPLTGQFAMLGDAVISSLFEVSPEVFGMQLAAAREFGDSYLIEDANHNPIGISAVTSLVKPGDLLHKNMIVPRDFMRRDPRLSAHHILGVFVRGRVAANGVLPDVDEVEVAGWASARELGRLRSSDKPPTFQTKLPSVFVPCTALHPIDTLLERFCVEELSG